MNLVTVRTSKTQSLTGLEGTKHSIIDQPLSEENPVFHKRSAKNAEIAAK